MPPAKLKLSDILDNLNLVVVTLNTESRIQYINPAAEMFFSCSLDRIHGRPFSHLIPDVELEKKLHAAISSCNTFSEIEYKLQFNRIQTIVNLTVTPLINKDKNIEIIIEIFQQDRHLKVSREESLVSQQQASRELLRSMAHEVKNPLGGIRGAAQLLEKELPTEELKEYTQVIINEADRLKLLVDRMLGPKSRPNKQRVNIHYVTERVRHLMKIDGSYSINLIPDYDPSIPEIMADPEYLIQAVLNLVKNAAQSISECNHCKDKNITFRSRVMRHYSIGNQYFLLVLKLDIIDTGPGIDKNKMEHIFMPLITTRAQGTGLGLSIAQSLINQNDGLIECISEPGNTVFSVLLPITKNKENHPS